MKTLLIRTLTGLFFVALVVLSFFVPSYYAFLLFLFFSVVGTHEFLQITKEKVSPSPVLTMGFSVSVYVAMTMIFSGGSVDGLLPYRAICFGAAFLSVIFLCLLLIVELYRKQQEPVLTAAMSIFPVAWIVFPLALMFIYREFFPSKGLALLILIWGYDTFAYCGGSLFGKHPLFERISPKKSWEGVVISFVLTSALAVGLSYIPYFYCGWKVWQWLIFAFCVIVASTFGDLVESLFKRNCGVKDSGTILPGHGGVLDRFDSLFMAAPIALLLILFFE